MAKTSGMSDLWEAGATVAAVAGVALAAGVTGLIWHRIKRLTKESPKKAVPVESVESIFQVLSDEQNLVANDKLYDALDELENVYGTAEVDAKLNEAVAEWSRNRPEGAGNPPGRADMVRVLRAIIQGCHEAKYREKVAQYCRKLVSIEQTNVNYRPLIEDVFVQLRAERSPDGRNGREAVREGDHLDDDRNGPEFLDFRGKNPGEIENMLRSAGNLVILGEPGSGKSTLLRYLAANCAESHSESPVVPLFLPLREVAAEVAAWKGDDSIFAEKAASFSRYKLDIHIPKEFFNRSLQEGRCLFFLDALDEVPASDRDAVVEKIGDLVEEYSTNRFVVTSRRAGYDDRPLSQTEGFFNRYLVQPMEDEDITSFVNSRFDDDPEEAAQAMSILDGNPGIKALAANPLHLAIFNMLQGRSSGLPLNRAEFYKQAVDILIEDKDDAGRRIDDARLERHENLLTHIARLFHDENRETIGRAELEERAADSLLEYRRKSDNPTRADEDEAFAEAEAFIERAERRTGLLVEEHPGSGVFRFVHATFREYLTAKDIHNRRRHYGRHREACWDEIKDHFTDARWREVILLLLGSLDDRYCTYLTEKILAAGDEALQPYEWEIPTHLQLAAEALANQASMSSELQQEIVGRLERVAKGNIPSRIFGFYINWKALGALGAVSHLPELVNPALASITTDLAVDAQTRVSAAEKLVRLGETDTATTALGAVATDLSVDAQARVSAAEGLGRLGETDKAIAILSAIATDPAVDAWPWVFAAEGLGRLGETDKAIAILSAIATDPAVDVLPRGSAAEGLGRLGETDKAIAILSAIATDPAVDAQTRGIVAEELGRLGETDKAIAILSAIATDPAVDVLPRVSATEKLGRLGETDKAMAILTAVITTANRSDVTWNSKSLVETLRYLGGTDKAIAILSAIATDPTVDAWLRVFAAEGLGRLGETHKAIAILSAIATDPAVDARTRLSAAEELGRLGGTDKAIAILSAIATDPTVDAWLRVFAAEGLGRLGETHKAIAILSAIATDPAVDARTRLSAAEELGRLGETHKAIATLSAIATDPAVDAWTRVFAAEKLGRLGETDKVIAILSAIATDSAVDAQTRLSTAEKLGRLGERHKAIATLSAIVADPAVDTRLRVSAAKKLVRLGETDKVISSLAAIATGPTFADRHRVSAARELARFGEDGIAELNAIAKGPDIAEVDRSHVVDALARVVRQPVESSNSEAAKAALAQLAQDDTVSADVRSRAAWQLGRLGEVQAAIASLTDLVKDPAAPAMEKVRAAGAIQEFGGSAEESIATMRAGIADPEIGIGDHVAMAWRMSDLGERDEGIAILAAIANDETVDDINRVGAAWYLGKLDASDSARPALNVLTAVAECETAELGLRLQAGKVLADLGVNETAIAALTAVGHSSEADAEDRIDAAEILAKLGNKATAQTVLKNIAYDRLLSKALRQEAFDALRKLIEE